MGAGPIGGIVGTKLFLKGADVTLADVSNDHLAAIHEHGLHIEAPEGTFTVPIKAIHPDQLNKGSDYDLIIVAVRAYHTAEVIKIIAPILNDATMVVSLQNGMCSFTIAQQLGDARTFGTMIKMPGIMVNPGHLRTYENGLFYVGHPSGNSTEQLKAIRDLLNKAVPTEITTNLAGRLWTKIIFASLRLAAALVDASIEKIFASTDRQLLFIRLASELCRASEMDRVRLEPYAQRDPLLFVPSEVRSLDECLKNVKEGGRIVTSSAEGHVRASQDLLEHRKTEVDYTLDWICGRARLMGRHLAVAEEVVRMVKEIESDKRELGWHNYEYLVEFINI